MVPRVRDPRKEASSRSGHGPVDGFHQAPPQLSVASMGVTGRRPLSSATNPNWLPTLSVANIRRLLCLAAHSPAPPARDSTVCSEYLFLWPMRPLWRSSHQHRRRQLPFLISSNCPVARPTHLLHSLSLSLVLAGSLSLSLSLSIRCRAPSSLISISR